MPHRRPFLSIVLLALVVAPAPLQAQRPMGIVDFLTIPRLGDARLSPNGQSLVYTLSEADWKTDRRITHIWRTSAKSDGEPVQLTRGTEGESAPRWSPDGKSIVFIAKRGDNQVAQLYRLPMDGGEAVQLTSHATTVSNPKWTPDGAAVYFIAADARTDEEQARDRVKDDVYRFEEDYKQEHLWKVTIANRTESRITNGDFSIEDYDVSDDGSKIALHRAPSPLLDADATSEIWIMNADGTGATQLTRNGVPESQVDLSPDGSRILFVANANARFEPYHNGRLFVVPAAGGSPQPLAGEREPYDVESAEWSVDGQSIYLLIGLGVHQELFTIRADGSGSLRQVTVTGDDRRNVSALSQSRSVIALTVSDATTTGEVWGVANGSARGTRITRVNDYLARDFKLGRQDAIRWKGADGMTVEGVLTYPVDYQAGQRYPLVVITHGGPQAADKYSVGSVSAHLQVLAGRGFAVLQPNYRGSTGYGDAFLRDMVGHYFQNAHLDVTTGVDELVRLGIADANRLVKMGWSGGGHMTNKIITFTDRFKAASSGAGAANWISMYAQSDTRLQRTPWFGGTPWQKDAPIDSYWDNSPLKYAANVKTPTIFFVGENDARVPMPQSIEMHRALKSNAVPTHLYIAPREPHGWTELRHQLFKINAEIDWFEKHANGRSYTWDKAPEPPPPSKPTTANEP